MEPTSPRQASMRLPQFRANRGVIGGINDDRNILEIFCSSPDEAWSADIDLLDGLFEGGVRSGNSGLEGVQIDDDEIDGRNAEFVQLPLVLLVASPRQDTGMNPRVECLDSPVQHFREACDVGHIDHRDIGFPQGASRSAGGDNLNGEARQSRCQFNQPGFIGDADQSSPNRRQPLIVYSLVRNRHGFMAPQACFSCCCWGSFPWQSTRRPRISNRPSAKSWIARG